MSIDTNTSVTTHPTVGSFKDKLAAALPEDFQCKVRYVHTAPKRCEPLFSTPPEYAPEVTRLANHFLTLSIDRSSGSADQNKGSVLVFGIEALVYTTKHLTTIFVSKADSTGYLPHQHPSPIKVTTTMFVHWLAAKERRKHPSRKLVISLFARSQTQYLFPGSAENSNKHVLDDRQLIKWWVRVLDPIFTERGEHHVSEEAEKPGYNGYITVPGYEGMAELRPFLPPHNFTPGTEQHWGPGNPLKELGKARGIPEDAPPRCLLPRFPDDPKARFMQDLDDEAGIAEDSQATTSPSKRRNGKWTSIRDLDRFWEAMGFRQECSSGRLVGFLWLVISTKSSEIIRRKVEVMLPNKTSGIAADKDALRNDPIAREDTPLANESSSRKRRRKPLTGPIFPRQPRLKGGSSSMTASDLNGVLDIEAGNGLVLAQDGYDKALHTLLHLDFANVEVAMQSTSKWIAEVSQICGIQTDWGLEVVGSAKVEGVKRDAGSNGHVKVNEVNDLGAMIRKKRKVEDQNATVMSGEAKPEVNILGAGMVRKKPKPTSA